MDLLDSLGWFRYNLIKLRDTPTEETDMTQEIKNIKRLADRLAKYDGNTELQALSLVRFLKKAESEAERVAGRMLHKKFQEI